MKKFRFNKYFKVLGFICISVPSFLLELVIYEYLSIHFSITKGKEFQVFSLNQYKNLVTSEIYKGYLFFLISLVAFLFVEIKLYKGFVLGRRR